jgi:hypothetical protein
MEKVMTRSCFYSFSQHDIYLAATKHPNQSGFVGFRHPGDAESICISESMMVKMSPHNFKHMTASQRAMCGCEVCLDGASFMSGSIVWRNKHWKEVVAIVEQLTDQGDLPELASMQLQLKNWEQAVFVHEDEPLLMDKFNNPKHKHETIDQWVAANICRNVKCGDGELCHFNCVIGHCVHCDAQSLPSTEEIGFNADNYLLVDEADDADDDTTPQLKPQPENPLMSVTDLEMEHKNKYEKFDKRDFVVFHMH